MGGHLTKESPKEMKPETALHSHMSASLLQAVMDGATDAIFVKDLDGRFRLFNRAAANFVGRKVEDVIGKTAADVFGQELGEAIRAAELEVLRTGQASTIEEVIVTGSGPRLFLATRSPYRDENGHIAGIVGISRDITDMRRAEDALRDSETRWQFAVDGAGDGIWDWDVTTGRVFYSHQWKAMLGYADDEVGNTTDDWSKRIHPDDLARCWQTIDDHFKDNAPVFIVEHRMRAKDGSWRWILDRGKVVERAADGSPLRVIGTHTDITERKLVEEELRLERERLQLAADVSGIGIWDYNIDADALKCDDTCYRIYGLDPALGQMRAISDFKALVHPDDVDRITDERIAELAMRTQDRHIEFRLIRPSGEVRWISSAAFMFKATDIAPNRLVGVVIDITVARLAEEKLRHSYDSLRRAEKIARIGSWALDLATGAFSTSDMLYEMNGADPNGPPLTPDDLQRMLPPDGFQKISAAIGRCIETGEPYGVDTLHYRPDGSSFAVHIRGEAQRDADGRIFALAGTVQDISEREEARARLEKLADNLPSGAIYRVEYGPDGSARMAYMSAGIERLAGLTAAEVFENPAAIMPLIHPDDIEHYLERGRVALATMDTYEVQFRIILPDGTIRWMHCRAAPSGVRPDGWSVWDGIMLDISQEKRMAEALTAAKEAAEAGERAKADFLATMSHEIRTPMNTVIGMTRLVQQTDLSPRQRNYLEKIDVSAKALLGIINDVLDYSKIEVGMLALEDAEFELEEVLETVSAVTAMRAEEKGIEIAYRVGANVPRRLRGDSLRLGQVLTNLVGNAVKFTHTGEIVVSVDCPPVGPGGDTMISFSVRDTGIGLTQEQISRLFRPFMQGGVHTSRRYGGTGLGLAICRELVELMGGRIGVDSQPGQGSNFHFTIKARTIGARRLSPETIAANPILTQTRVLIVDDNASAREILSDMLRLFGMRAEAVASGEEGLDALRRASARGFPFAIVLMDWRMPGMDGLEAARRIREEEHLAQTPAVLMVTAYGREEVLQRVEQLGLQGLLIKPITESVMFNTLIEILQPRASGEADDEPAAAQLIQADPRASLAGRTILVVDDNALNREVATDFLELMDVHVVTANNGAEALDALETGSFDAVLMDIHMPVMDGLEATRIIRRNPKWAKLPIIALTAQARSEDRVVVEAAGMNGHLTKPIDESRLYGILASFVSANGETTAKPPFNGLHSGNDAPPPRHIDLAAMTARFGGRSERISRLLKGFLRDFSGTPTEIDRCVRAGDAIKLASIAHTLKGSLGYLGANDFAGQAERLETAARSGRLHTVHDLTATFTQNLRQLLAEVETADRFDLSGAQQAGENADATVATLVAKLGGLIRDGDYDAMALIEQLSTRLADAGHKAHLERVRQSFEDLEREDALYALRDLASALAPFGDGRQA